ncbi:RidA family protein [Leucobacter sp. M11]|uniref:RidA family protein n=1 Tax=Leucobacter sp. M11 TaxID=2993565 RepID=UPI002D7F5D19|nr:RidA family protein [Leucobacter sp. M11]MEB4614945.1 RidA family protein [Leucobacter sp. M11]
MIDRLDDPRVPALPTHSHAVRVGNLVFIAGQVGIPLGEDHAPAGFADEVGVALDALDAVLETVGATRGTVLRTNCYLANIDQMPEFNAVYLARFGDLRPARTTTQARLAHGLRFEIDAVALCEPEHHQAPAKPAAA